MEVFDINNYLLVHAVNESNSKNKKEASEMTFEKVWRKVKEHFDSQFDSNKITDSEKQIRQEYEHRAMIGDKEAENYLTTEIELYLRENNLMNVDFPSYYESLQEACFHEIYRFGSLKMWDQYPDSPSAIIQGDEIWFKINGRFERKGKLRSEQHIEEIIRTMGIGNSYLKVNESNPEAEVDIDGGIRVKILVPPRSYKPTIIFRRFVVQTFSFEEQAKRGTIPYEDVQFYRAMAQLHLNTIIAGPVESGKSTMLKTIYSERSPEKVAVLIETSPETYLKRDFPNRLVHDFYTTNGNVEQIIRDALRVDHDYIIAQEVRGIEAEGAISGTERGTRGLLMTYHLTNPKNTVKQLARHIIDAFPNRKEINEIRRIAEHLDLGITMATMPGNRKKITSLYEICYDDITDRVWINYLIKYDKKDGYWRYNAKVSEQLKERMFIYDEELANLFLSQLKQRASVYPIQEETEIEVNYKEEIYASNRA